MRAPVVEGRALQLGRGFSRAGCATACIDSGAQPPASAALLTSPLPPKLLQTLNYHVPSNTEKGVRAYLVSSAVSSCQLASGEAAGKQHWG